MSFCTRRHLQSDTAEPCGGYCDESEASSDQLILRLNDQLREKDMKLTDVRLEALSSAHQRQQLRELVSRMKVCRCVNSTAAVIHQTWNWVIGSPGQWVIWVIFYVRVAGSSF